MTIDRQCGSSQQAIHFAAQGVLSGTQDLVVAAGIESMSQVPMGSTVAPLLEKGLAFPYGKGWTDRYGKQEISQFRGAQLMCEKWGIKRQALEEFSFESHQRAIRAIDEGRFEREIARCNGVSADEGPRRDSTLEKMADLKPLREGWEITAAVASQISDGSAAVLIASEDAVQRHGLTPRARIHTLTVTGADPVFMLTGPIPATERALARAKPQHRRHRCLRGQRGLRAVPIVWAAETGASLERTNPNGGAIALGHPLGGHRRDPDDQAAARARAHRRPVRPADHVRRRRPGQRHHHRARVTARPRLRRAEPARQ